MTGRLEGKVAVITGAGSVGPGWGNGRAAAVLFAREGAKVFAVDLDPDALAETVRLIEKGIVDIHTCDVTDNAAVGQMVAACVDTFGRVDVLVNNVGGSRPGGPVELSEQDWHAQLDYNLTSVYLTCKHVIPVMKANGGGAIVNTASTSGTRFTGSPQVGYAAAKAGVIQFSKVTAVQHAADGIRVNTVVPGQLHTPLVEARLAGQRAAWGRRNAAGATQGPDSAGVHGRRPGHRVCRAVPGLGRGPVRHGHGDRRRRRHDREV